MFLHMVIEMKKKKVSTNYLFREQTLVVLNKELMQNVKMYILYHYRSSKHQRTTGESSL